MSPTTSTRTFMKPPTENPKNTSSRPPLRIKKRLPWILVAFLLIFSIFMVYQYQSAKRTLQHPAVNNSQVKNVIDKVSKLIIIPSNEQPTVATVVHASKLKSQSFFAAAKDGDKVLVFNRHRQAILYRPSTNQLVNVSTVSVTPSVNNP